MPIRADMRGFTLLELVAAAAVLILSTAAGTGILGLALASHGSGGRCSSDRDAAAQLLWALDALPYASNGPGSLLGEVFPHAAESRNVDDSFYSAAGTDSRPAACFIRRHEVGGRSLLTVARFQERDGDGSWRDVPDSAIAGLSFDEAVPPAAVRVEVYPAGRMQGAPVLTRLCFADAVRDGAEP